MDLYIDRTTKDDLRECGSLVRRLEAGGHSDHLLWQQLATVAYEAYQRLVPETHCSAPLYVGGDAGGWEDEDFANADWSRLD